MQHSGANFARQIFEFGRHFFLKTHLKNSGLKIRSCGNTTPILKLSDENIEKLKSLRLFGEVNFAFIANRNISNFDPIWQFFHLSYIYISTNIKL